MMDAGTERSAEAVQRRHFHLREEDIEVLGCAWVALGDRNRRGHHWLIMHGYPIGPGYTAREVSAAVILGPCYPHEQIDMVYFDPPLARLDGNPIGSVSPHSLDGRQWQALVPSQERPKPLARGHR